VWAWGRSHDKALDAACELIEAEGAAKDGPVDIAMLRLEYDTPGTEGLIMPPWYNDYQSEPETAFGG
jgi:hypothetical protein